MLKIEENNTICGILKMFYLLQIWKNGEETSSQKLRRKLCPLLTFIVFQIVCVIYALMSDDRNLSMFLISVVIFTVVLTVKLTYLLWNKDEVEECLYENDFSSLPENHENSMLVNRNLQKFNRFVQIFYLLLSFTAAFVNLSPLPIFSTEKMLPLFITFTLRFKYANILYWILYIILLLGGILSMIANSLSILIWYIMLKYSLEYQVLGNYLKDLGVSKKTTAQLREVSKSPYEQDLIKLSKLHEKLSEKIERFKSLYSTLFVAQLGTSAMSICFSTYNLVYTSQQNVIQTEIYMFCLFYGIFDIFLVMYLGNEIMLGSDRLSYCFFESNWVEQSQSCKKCIIIMCEVLKQPQQLVILKLYPINLETFTRIINGAYSMFNILKNFK